VQKIKIYLILLAVLFIFGLAALTYIISAFTPERLGNILLFYLLIGLTAFAAATLINFFIRRVFGQREFLNSYIVAASREGIWLSLVLVISLILAHNNLFSWVNAALLVLTFVFFESYLLNKNNN